LNFEALDSS